jgi:probable rRNA maturation factor
MTGRAQPSQGIRGKRQPPRYAIDVSNPSADNVLTPTRLRRIARAALEAEQVSAATISIALVDNAEIRRLNRRHLSHDYATDVLSFLFDSDVTAGAGRRIDGEVVASVEMATRCAPRFDWTPAEELALYLVHGLLHLCGYDDHTAADRRTMNARQRAILGSLGIGRGKPAGTWRDTS